MKVKNGYVLHEIAGENLILPEASADFNSVLTLNETGAFLWHLLQSETDEAALLDAILNEYRIDEPTAKEHIRLFVERLKEYDLLA